MLQRKIITILNALLWLAVLVFVVSKCRKPEPSPHSEATQTIEVYKEGGQYKSDLDFPIDRWPQTVIVDSSNFWKPGDVTPVPPDTITPPKPPIVHFDFEVETEAQLTDAAAKAKPGDTVAIKNGTYRITVVPASSGVVFVAYPEHEPLISGLNNVTTPWVVHSGSIYKTNITLPVNGHNKSLTSNTTLLSNQIFQSGDMMFEARWPNIGTETDMMDINKTRNIGQMVRFDVTSLQDNGLKWSGLTGAQMTVFGWFWPVTRLITSQPSTNTLNYSALNNDMRYRRYYYISGKLQLLDTEKEWHYENGTFYFWQPGGGVPVAVEYKARNWGFDLRGKSDITVIGIHFKGCEPVTTDERSANILVDNIRANYLNHSVMMDINDFPGYGNSKQTGLKLIGPNSVIKNSELQWAASGGVWLGEKGQMINCLAQYWGYEGSWGAPVDIWADYDNQKILWNTLAFTGRSNIDLGYSYTGGGSHKNLNIEVAHNNLSKWGMLNNDLGAIYAWGFRDLTGGIVHHNWFHDAGVVPDPTGRKLDGGQRGMYLDQASGPITFHHNLLSNNFENLTQDASDHYTQPYFEHRNAGSSYLYNNTYASSSPHSYTTYVNSPIDVMVNNIFVKKINMNWGNADPPNNKNSITMGTDPQFVGPGDKFEDYQLRSTSPAINKGAVIEGITDGSVGVPDIGAFEYGATPWTVGYKPVKITPPDLTKIEDTDARTKYSDPATRVNSTAFSGGTATFMTVAGSTITVDFSGSGVEWWTEKMENHGIVQVYLDQELEATVDLYDGDIALDENNSQRVWSKAGLGSGSHHLVLKLFGKNQSSSGVNIIHDYLKITPAAAQQSHTGRILLIVFLLIVFIALVIYFTRRTYLKNHPNGPPR
jgi:hypothetical protein